MLVAHLLQELSEHPPENLVRDMKEGSATLKTLKERFIRAANEVKVLSCYELRLTPTSTKKSDGSFVRDGPKRIMVTQESACLYWSNETRMPINENHSMIAKLSRRPGSAYHGIKDYMAQIVHEARNIVPNRFLRWCIYKDLTVIVSVSTSLQHIVPSLENLEPSLRDEIANKFLQIQTFCRLLHDEKSGSVFIGDHVSQAVITHIANIVQELKTAITPYSNQDERQPIDEPILSSRRIWASAGVTELRAAGSIAKTLYNPNSVKELHHKMSRLIVALQHGMCMFTLRMQESNYLERAKVAGGPKQIVLSERPWRKDVIRSVDSPKGLSPLPGILEGQFEGELKEKVLIGQYKKVDGTKRSVIVEFRNCFGEGGLGAPALSQAPNDRRQAASVRDQTRKLVAVLQNLCPLLDIVQELQDCCPQILRCIGYIDEEAEDRLALLYEIPAGYSQNNGMLSPGVMTLKQAIQVGHVLNLPLEQRFSLAYKLCATLLSLHASGWTHRSICAANVLLVPSFKTLIDGGAEPGKARSWHLEPYLKGFQFAGEALVASLPVCGRGTGEQDPYCHLDERKPSVAHSTKEHDMYALGLVLLEIGTGISIQQLYEEALSGLNSHNGPSSIAPEDFRGLFMEQAAKRLPRSMGSKYTEAVITCLGARLNVGRGDKAQTELALVFQRLILDAVANGLYT
jgi:hypothetical protein